MHMLHHYLPTCRSRTGIRDDPQHHPRVSAIRHSSSLRSPLLSLPLRRRTPSPPWDSALLRGELGFEPVGNRGNMKRADNLVTLCLFEAAARVFLFEQTAVGFLAPEHRPTVPGAKPAPLPFEIGMLVDVLRAAHPTREMAHFVWSMGLEYAPPTSTRGLTVMRALGEAAGLTENVQLQAPVHEGTKPEELVPPPNGTARDLAAQRYLRDMRTLDRFTPTEVLKQAQALASSRERRHDVRRRASQRPLGSSASVAPLARLRTLYAEDGDDAWKRPACALFPSYAETQLFYLDRNLCDWMVRSHFQNARFMMRHISRRTGSGIWSRT